MSIGPCQDAVEAGLQRVDVPGRESEGHRHESSDAPGGRACLYSALRRPAAHAGGSPPMLSGFRDFIMKGNVVDLAVAVVIGAAFGAVVTSFTTNILTPLLGLIG